MRSTLRTFALAISAWLVLAPVARAEVQVSIRNGRVTIVAKDATVRQILTEWGRVGKTKIVNGERIPGGPLTLELKDVSEAEALDVLLRSLSGYMAAPRMSSAAADASVYDSIVVMPTIATARPSTSSAPSGAPAAFSPPSFTQNPNDDEQEGNAPVRPGGVAPVRPPIFSTFPAPQPGNATAPRPVLPVVRPGIVPTPSQNPTVERQPSESNQLPGPAPPVAAPSASPGGFVGTSAPGMMPPAASQPGQIVQPRPNGGE